jgi:hypothetical protein
LRVSTSRKVVLCLLAAPLLVVGLVAGIWAVDTWAAGDTVARNVTLAGVPVGGMDPAELRTAVEQLAADDLRRGRSHHRRGRDR